MGWLPDTKKVRQAFADYEARESVIPLPPTDAILTPADLYLNACVINLKQLISDLSKAFS